MRLPQWLIACLIATGGVAVLTTGALLWAEWPERTAREFVDIVARNKNDAATKLGKSGNDDDMLIITLDSEEVLESWNQVNLECGQRTLLDVIVGRQKFAIRTCSYWFEVERGGVITRSCWRKL